MCHFRHLSSGTLLVAVLTIGSFSRGDAPKAGPTDASLPQEIFVTPSGGSLDTPDAVKTIWSLTEVNTAWGYGDVRTDVKGPHGDFPPVFHLHRDQPTFLAPPAAPVLSTSTTGGNIPGSATYRFYVTYINAQGETNFSPMASITTGTGSTNSITVASPAATGTETGVALKWNVYAGSPPGYWPFYLQTNGTAKNGFAGSPAIGANQTLTTVLTSGTYSQPGSINFASNVHENALRWDCNIRAVSDPSPGYPKWLPAPWIHFSWWSKANLTPGQYPGFMSGLDNYYSPRPGHPGGNGGTGAGTSYYWGLGPDLNYVGTWDWIHAQADQHINGWENNSSIACHVLFHNSFVWGDLYWTDLQATPFYPCTLASDGKTLTVDYGYMSSDLRFLTPGDTGMTVRVDGVAVPVESAVIRNYLAPPSELNERTAHYAQPASTGAQRSQVILTLGSPVAQGRVVTVQKTGGSLVDSDTPPTTCPDFPVQSVIDNGAQAFKQKP